MPRDSQLYICTHWSEHWVGSCSLWSAGIAHLSYVPIPPASDPPESLFLGLWGPAWTDGHMGWEDAVEMGNVLSLLFS